jgi:hypothetical protein
MISGVEAAIAVRVMRCIGLSFVTIGREPAFVCSDAQKRVGTVDRKPHLDEGF